MSMSMKTKLQKTDFSLLLMTGTLMKSIAVPSAPNFRRWCAEERGTGYF